MNLHLNWDNNQSNGIIFNDAYPTGALFTGANLKPNIGIPYDSMQYSEVFEVINYVQVGNVKTVMLQETEDIVMALATAWVQPHGQEGNPTIEQLKVTQKQTITGRYKEAERLPVIVANDSYTGGEASAVAISNVVTMTKESNRLLGTDLQVVTITDEANLPHEMNFDSASVIALTIGSASQANFQKKQSLKVQIDNATTKAEVSAVVW